MSENETVEVLETPPEAAVEAPKETVDYEKKLAELEASYKVALAEKENAIAQIQAELEATKFKTELQSLCAEKGLLELSDAILNADLTSAEGAGIFLDSVKQSIETAIATAAAEAMVIEPEGDGGLAEPTFEELDDVSNIDLNTLKKSMKR